jgi:hypothetical protein
MTHARVRQARRYGTQLGETDGTGRQKRPADVIGNAVKVMRIATGEIEEDVDDDGKDKAAQALGRKGGKARATKLSKKRRSEIAKKAAATRWRRG